MSTFQVVDEVDYGVYLWRFSDGSFAGDSEGNYLSINATRGDRAKIETLQKAVKYYFGTIDGDAVFDSGRRKVTDDEYAEQKYRMEMGLTPDPYDLPALIEEAKAAKKWQK